MVTEVIYVGRVRIERLAEDEGVFMGFNVWVGPECVGWKENYADAVALAWCFDVSREATPATWVEQAYQQYAVVSVV